MAGEPARVRIFRIDDVAHFGGERTHLGVMHHFFFIIDESRVASQHADGDGVRNAELGGIAVRRILLRGERFPQAMHDAVGGLAFDGDHVAGRNPLSHELARAVDVGMRHGAAGVGLEGDVGAEPLLARAFEHAGEITVIAVGEGMKETVVPLQQGARPGEARLRQARRAITRLRGPTRMQALGPRAFGKIFDDPGSHAAGDAQRVDPLRSIETQRRGDRRRRAERAENRGGMKPGLVHTLGRGEA